MNDSVSKPTRREGLRTVLESVAKARPLPEVQAIVV